MKKLGSLVISLTALLITVGAQAGDRATTASHAGPAHSVRGDGDGNCLYSYQIQKVGPDRADFDEEIRYKIILDNLGDCDLRHIRVTDDLPRGTELVSAEPKPDFPKNGLGDGDDNRRLVWNRVTLEEGEEAIFVVKVKLKDDDDHHRLRRFLDVTNTGCAFTPWIGTEICGTATTQIDWYK